MKNLVVLAQDIQRVAYKEHPYFGVPFIRPLVKIFYKQDRKAAIEFIKENEETLKSYPGIYRYLCRELEEIM